MKIIIWIVCILIALLIVGWSGLKIKPKPFPLYSSRTPAMEFVPLPAGLPAPVERFYRQIFGDQIAGDHLGGHHRAGDHAPEYPGSHFPGSLPLCPCSGCRLQTLFRDVLTSACL